MVFIICGHLSVSAVFNKPVSFIDKKVLILVWKS